MTPQNEKYLHARRNIQRDMDYIDPEMISRSVDAWTRKGAGIRQRIRLMANALTKQR